MPTDRHYLLFVHDVNTRERRESPDYADYLFDLINCKVRSSSPGHVQLSQAMYCINHRFVDCKYSSFLRIIIGRYWQSTT